MLDPYQDKCSAGLQPSLPVPSQGCTPVHSHGPAFICCLHSLAVLLPADPPWWVWRTSWFLSHTEVLLGYISPALPKAASARLPVQGPNDVGEQFCVAASLFKIIHSISLPSVILRRKQKRKNNKLKLLPNQRRNQCCLLSLWATIRCHQQIWAACLGCSLSSREV